MRVAMIGLGKLGLPVACAMSLTGHKVYGYDISLDKREQCKRGKSDLYEPNFEFILNKALDSRFHIVDSVNEAVEQAEIIFIAVPTPSKLSGEFSTKYVEDVLRKVSVSLIDTPDFRVIAVISTVLPETSRSIFLPLIRDILGPPEEGNYGFCYNAQFIAMGSVIQNFYNSEFMLIGEYDKNSGDLLEKFYQQVNPEMKVFRTTLENAEIIKMAYNTFIGLKIVFANTILELCDKIPNANCDVVSNALSLATDRLISNRYLTGGMGDGGPCHPRDQRALDWLAHELKLSANPFSFVSDARIEQTEYLADVVLKAQEVVDLPVAIMGLTFKPDTDLLDDSPSLLLARCLVKKGLQTIHMYDPVAKPDHLPSGPFVYVLATRRPKFKTYDFAPGSVIVDPWRMLEKAPKDCLWRPVGVGP